MRYYTKEEQLCVSFELFAIFTYKVGEKGVILPQSVKSRELLLHVKCVSCPTDRQTSFLVDVILARVLYLIVII